MKNETDPVIVRAADIARATPEVIDAVAKLDFDAPTLAAALEVAAATIRQAQSAQMLANFTEEQLREARKRGGSK